MEELSNLIEGISFKLGYKKPTLAHIEEDKREQIEKQFLDYFENQSKTGFYIHTNPEDASSEEVLFFNYNEEGGWWLKVEEKGYVFFDKDAALLELKPEQLNEAKYTLKQFSQDSNQKKAQTEMNFNKYDYALFILYAKKESLQTFKAKLDNNKFNNLAISAVKAHDASDKDFRVTVFIGKYPEFDGDDQVKLDALLSEVNQLAPQIFINCVVKEEIKYFFQDFEEDTQLKIIECTQQHRYECLYNSESDHSEKSSDDDDDDEEHAHHSKDDGEEDEDQSQEGSDDDDDDDNQNETQPKLFFAEKKV